MVSSSSLRKRKCIESFDATECLPTNIFPDTPLLTINRKHLVHECYNEFVKEKFKYSTMKGSSIMAKRCQMSNKRFKDWTSRYFFTNSVGTNVSPITFV